MWDLSNFDSFVNQKDFFKNFEPQTAKISDFELKIQKIIFSTLPIGKGDLSFGESFYGGSLFADKFHHLDEGQQTKRENDISQKVVENLEQELGDMRMKVGLMEQERVLLQKNFDAMRGEMSTEIMRIRSENTDLRQKLEFTGQENKSKEELKKYYEDQLATMNQTKELLEAKNNTLVETVKGLKEMIALKDSHLENSHLTTDSDRKRREKREVLEAEWRMMREAEEIKWKELRQKEEEKRREERKVEEKMRRMKIEQEEERLRRMGEEQKRRFDDEVAGLERTIQRLKVELKESTKDLSNELEETKRLRRTLDMFKDEKEKLDKYIGKLKSELHETQRTLETERVEKLEKTPTNTSHHLKTLEDPIQEEEQNLFNIKTQKKEALRSKTSESITDNSESQFAFSRKPPTLDLPKITGFSPSRSKTESSRIIDKNILKMGLDNSLFYQPITQTGPEPYRTNRTDSRNLKNMRSARAFKSYEMEIQRLMKEIMVLRQHLVSKTQVIEQQKKNLNLSNQLAFKVSGALEDLKLNNDHLIEELEEYKTSSQSLEARLHTMTKVITELRKRNQKLETTSAGTNLRRTHETGSYSEFGRTGGMMSTISGDEGYSRENYYPSASGRVPMTPNNDYRRSYGKMRVGKRFGRPDRGMFEVDRILVSNPQTPVYQNFDDFDDEGFGYSDIDGTERSLGMRSRDDEVYYRRFNGGRTGMMMD
jgi:hypothetical protein